MKRLRRTGATDDALNTTPFRSACRGVGIALAVALLLPALPAGAQTVDWAAEFHVTGYEARAKVNSVVTDEDGNMYTLGEFYGMVDFDPGPGTFELTAERTTAFVSKVDPRGALVWVEAFEPLIGYMEGLAWGPGEGLYLSGRFTDTGDFDPGSGSLEATCPPPVWPNRSSCWFVLKLDPAGTLVWLRSGEGNDVYSLNTAVGPDGGVYTAGSFTGTTDFDPGPGSALRSGVARAFVQKLDSAGNFVWVRAFGADAWPGQHEVAADRGGNVLTLFSVGRDYLLSKLDSKGNLVWEHGARETEDGTYAGRDLQLAVDAQNNVLFAYAYRPTPHYGSISSLVKLDPNGFVQSAVQPDWHPRDMATDGQGNLWLVGRFDGTRDFDPGPGEFHLTSMTWEDLFVSRLDSELRFVSAKHLGGWSRVWTPIRLAIDSAGNARVTGSKSRHSECPSGPRTAPPPLFTSPQRDAAFLIRLDGRAVGPDGHEGSRHPDRLNLDFRVDEEGVTGVQPIGPCPCFTHGELMQDAAELRALLAEPNSGVSCELHSGDDGWGGQMSRLSVRCSYGTASRDNRLCDYGLEARDEPWDDQYECSYHQGPGNLCRSGSRLKSGTSAVSACRELIDVMGEKLGCTETWPLESPVTIETIQGSSTGSGDGQR